MMGFFASLLGQDGLHPLVDLTMPNHTSMALPEPVMAALNNSAADVVKHAGVITSLASSFPTINTPTKICAWSLIVLLMISAINNFIREIRAASAKEAKICEVVEKAKNDRKHSKEATKDRNDVLSALESMVAKDVHTPMNLRRMSLVSFT